MIEELAQIYLKFIDQLPQEQLKSADRTSMIRLFLNDLHFLGSKIHNFEKLNKRDLSEGTDQVVADKIIHSFELKIIDILLSHWH